MSDDAAGLLVVRELRRHLQSFPDARVDVREVEGSVLDAILAFRGYAFAILVDTVRSSSQHSPGSVIVADAADLAAHPSYTPHDISFTDALSLLKTTYPKQSPRHIKFCLIAGSCFSAGNTLSPPVQLAIPRAVEAILSILRKWRLLR